MCCLIKDQDILEWGHFAEPEVTFAYQIYTHKKIAEYIQTMVLYSDL